jgi:hypothetical protein
MLPRTTLLRLETQLEVIPLLLGGSTPREIVARSPSGQWSVHENLAHLARHHSIMLERLVRMLTKEAPTFERYSAEADPEWPAWSALDIDEILDRLSEQRFELVQLLEGLAPPHFDRVGRHPALGTMAIPKWIEFFLLHEAHHLYLVQLRLGQARTAGTS